MRKWLLQFFTIKSRKKLKKNKKNALKQLNKKFSSVFKQLVKSLKISVFLPILQISHTLRTHKWQNTSPMQPQYKLQLRLKLGLT